MTLSLISIPLTINGTKGLAITVQGSNVPTRLLPGWEAIIVTNDGLYMWTGTQYAFAAPFSTIINSWVSSGTIALLQGSGAASLPSGGELYKNGVLMENPPTTNTDTASVFCSVTQGSSGGSLPPPSDSTSTVALASLSTAVSALTVSGASLSTELTAVTSNLTTIGNGLGSLSSVTGTVTSGLVSLSTVTDLLSTAGASLSTAGASLSTAGASLSTGASTLGASVSTTISAQAALINSYNTANAVKFGNLSTAIDTLSTTTDSNAQQYYQQLAGYIASLSTLVGK